MDALDNVTHGPDRPSPSPDNRTQAARFWFESWKLERPTEALNVSSFHAFIAIQTKVIGESTRLMSCVASNVPKSTPFHACTNSSPRIPNAAQRSSTNGAAPEPGNFEPVLFWFRLLAVSIIAPNLISFSNRRITAIQSHLLLRCVGFNNRETLEYDAS